MERQSGSDEELGLSVPKSPELPLLESEEFIQSDSKNLEFEEDSDENDAIDSDSLAIDDGNDEDDEEEEEEEDLPPILQLPTSGCQYREGENRSPPLLERAIQSENKDEEGEDIDDILQELDEASGVNTAGGEDVEVWISDSERSSNTDSDDDLVKVDYCKKPPKEFRKLLNKYAFINKRSSAWVQAVQSFYKKQPSRIRKFLKMHKDAKGNPIEESVGVLFEKIHAERERIRKAFNIKTEKEEEEDRAISAVSVKVDGSDPRLIHVAYPANVVNDDKAIGTLGGIGAISKIFEQPNKKLVLKFRPNDPFVNGVNAVGRTACGLLLRVRRRKIPASQPSSASTQDNSLKGGATDKKIDLDSLGSVPPPVESIHDILLDNQNLRSNKGAQAQAKVRPPVVINTTEYRQHNLLFDDKSSTDIKCKDLKNKRAWGPGPGDTKEFSLEVPETFKVEDDPNLKVETLGIIHRSFEFNGICDFQYLPAVRNGDGQLVSVKDRLFPILGAKDNPEKLVCKDIITEAADCQTFILPPAMSRIDNPPKGLIDELINSDKADRAAKKPPPDDSIFSSRLKRIIYTISYNFQADGSVPPEEAEVPSQPLRLAVKDMERRQIKRELIENVRLKFEERPIWSKVALAFVTKISPLTLKFIIPSFAYFAANGPWRNTWIKFGVDPRKIQGYVVYQSVDFRVPFIYRKFLEEIPKNPEAAHKFSPQYAPPKTQMFYQLSDIKLDEINELIVTLNKKAASKSLVYDERFGFLKEGTYEYFRYILNYYIENLLQECGKIPETEDAEVSFKIPAGEIEPTSKLKAAPHRRVKVKRIRRSTKKAPSLTVTTTGTVKKGGGGKKKSPGSKSNRSYPESLEDLALNDLPNETGEGMDDYDPDDDDDEYLDE
ncbi:unnamed protein product [Orchesella dallaii]|uniref:General transcription factor 3C polypeptide 5 n=1 Tax=Orchesella dallaii TaxID=48710 RepID=A0ABP1R7M2_9HEXA